MGLQAAEIRHKHGVFWGVQYHPEYSCAEIAAMARRYGEVLIRDKLVKDQAELDALAADLVALNDHPDDARLAWRFGVGASITDPAVKLAELRNWLEKAGAEVGRRAHRESTRTAAYPGSQSLRRIDDCTACGLRLELCLARQDASLPPNKSGIRAAVRATPPIVKHAPDWRFPAAWRRAVDPPTADIADGRPSSRGDGTARARPRRSCCTRCSTPATKTSRGILDKSEDACRQIVEPRASNVCARIARARR